MVTFFFLFKIKTSKFLEFRDEIGIILAWADVDPEDRKYFYYFSYQEQTACNRKTYVGGSLYNDYKYLRSKLIEANIINKVVLINKACWCVIYETYLIKNFFQFYV